MSTEDSPEVFIPLGTIDKSKIVIHDPITNVFTKNKGGSEIEWCTSKAMYLNDDGVECEPYFELSEQFCFGMNGVYPMSTADEDKRIENMTGMQICYPLTSMTTIDNPVEKEKQTKEVFDTIYECSWDNMVEQCNPDIESEERKVPPPSYNSYIAATSGKTLRKNEAFKPPYSFPLVKSKENSKKKVEDRSKPQRAYIKLMTKGEGRKMKFHTHLYGPGDKKESPFKYIDKKGKVTPVMKWEGIYWGAHGVKPYGASIQLRISEMNYTPLTDGGPKRRMLGRNTAPIPEDESSGSENEGGYEDGNEHEEGFAQPGDSQDQMNMLGNRDQEEPEEQKEPEKEEETPIRKTKPKTSVEKRKEALKKKAANKTKKNE